MKETETLTVHPDILLQLIGLQNMRMPVLMPHRCEQGHIHGYRVLAIHPEICSVTILTTPEA